MARDAPSGVFGGEERRRYGVPTKSTKDLYEKYGQWRVLDTPIAEDSFTRAWPSAPPMTGLQARSWKA